MALRPPMCARRSARSSAGNFCALNGRASVNSVAGILRYVPRGSPYRLQRCEQATARGRSRAAPPTCRCQNSEAVHSITTGLTEAPAPRMADIGRRPDLVAKGQTHASQRLRPCSVTLSACASTVSGMVKPSAFSMSDFRRCPAGRGTTFTVDRKEFWRDRRGRREVCCLAQKER
jgi:hypothetical protein